MKGTLSFVFSFFLFLAILTLLGCVKEDRKALEILQRSIKAHGGKSLWEKVNSISYLKETTLHVASGEIEQQISQKITHLFRPQTTEIIWMKDGKVNRAIKNPKGVLLYQNDQLQNDSLLIAQTESSLDAALYVFWQPYKLLDQNIRLDYIGEKKLLDSIAVYGLKATYSNSDNRDIWTYYFDKNNYRLRAAQVYHKQRTSLILNESVESETGLFLNKRRKSYFLDSLGKIKYLRAAYSYRIESFNID